MLKHDDEVVRYQAVNLLEDLYILVSRMSVEMKDKSLRGIDQSRIFSALLDGLDDSSDFVRYLLQEFLA